MRYSLTLMLLAFFALSCKKNNSTASSGNEANTFLKVYGVHIQNSAKSTNTTINASGSVTSDENGNIYAWYFDSLISGARRIAIIKTDKNGAMIWNKSYFEFSPSSWDIDLINNNYIWQDFVCIGQTLFLCGSDAANKNWAMLKIDCADGKITGQFSLNNLIPANNNYFLIRSIWPTKNGNILVNCSAGMPNGYTKPVLSMFDQSGNLIWMKNNFPCPFSDSGNFNESPFTLMELSNGDFIYGSIGMYSFTANDASITSSVLYFHHLTSSGNLVRTDSLAQGAFNWSGNPPFYNSDGTSQHFSLLTSSLGGYIIVSNEDYAFSTATRIKILKTDASFRVTDSSYVDLGNSFAPCVVQNNSGDIVMSVVSQVLPLPNFVCTLYKIGPDGHIVNQSEIGLPHQSVFVSGMFHTADDHILISGLIQSANIDTNNLFILKTDNNVRY